ncbi:MAG: hypothetical protein R2684_13195 [Pyrinomonadaceae bacterium]
MRRPKVVSVVTLVLVILTVFSGCKKKDICDPIDTSLNMEVLAPARTSLEVDVFIDATPSMQGFVVPGPSTVFGQTLTLLESATISGTASSKINFFKFGSTITPLPNRQHLEALKPRFYGGSSGTKTLIEKVIAEADPEHLTLIVTDLFQDNADVNQLSEKIKAKFITNNLAIGFLGLKSQFDGTIYDVGPANLTIKYTNRSETETYRPFYIVAFGPHADISAYFESLDKAGFAGFPERNTLIMSKHIVQRTADLSQSKVIAANGLSEVTGVIVKSGRIGSRFKEFKVKNSQSADLTTQIPISRTPYSLEYSEEFDVQHSMQECSKTSDGTKSSFQPLSTSGLLTKALVRSMADGELKVSLTLNPRSIKKDTTTCMRVILKPSKFVLPKWVNAWNMTANEVPGSSDQGEIDGSKTYNLGLFLSTLWSATNEVHQPKIADLQFYFRK